MITLEQYLMGRDKKYPSEYNDTIKKNALQLIDKVNSFLTQIGAKSVVVTSGWRPAAVNGSVKGAASNSKHLTGSAVDLADADGKLWELISKNLPLAKKLGLYFEDKRWTPTWCHIQVGPPKSGKRVYVPSSAPALAPKAWDGVYDKSLDD